MLTLKKIGWRRQKRKEKYEKTGGVAKRAKGFNQRKKTSILGMRPAEKNRRFVKQTDDPGLQGRCPSEKRALHC